jgi:hypothetical protein|tara:strand:- start:72 stop:536 length:465 start_codon:yes stop_codon:yes gene_type:complete
MAYIYPGPGSAAAVTLNLKVDGDTIGLDLPALQDVTLNAANDVFTWTQLDQGSKLQIATTATNSLGMNIVLDQTVFFGTTVAGEEAQSVGIFGISTAKTRITFELYLGDTSEGGTGKTISGTGYITGLAPTVSADSPVWVSPITITVDSDYTVA